MPSREYWWQFVIKLSCVYKKWQRGAAKGKKISRQVRLTGDFANALKIFGLERVICAFSLSKAASLKRFLSWFSPVLSVLPNLSFYLSVLVALGARWAGVFLKEGSDRIKVNRQCVCAFSRKAWFGLILHSGSTMIRLSSLRALQWSGGRRVGGITHNLLKS